MENNDLINKIMKLYEESLHWDYDGSHWISEENADSSKGEFKDQLLEILKTSKL